MKIRIKLTALLLCTVITMLSLCSCGLWELVPEFARPDKSDSYHEIQDMVTVSVEDGYFYTVTSPNPVKVNRGADATFTIEIREGYEFASAELEMVPDTYVKLDDEDTATKMQKMLDMFEDNDDIQNVWHNWEA